MLYLTSNLYRFATGVSTEKELVTVKISTLVISLNTVCWYFNLEMFVLTPNNIANSFNFWEAVYATQFIPYTMISLVYHLSGR